MRIELKTAQLLNSRLFHDLVGAASAISAGVEFMAEPAGADDAVDLLNRSAARMARRLDFFRGAFGLGGGKQGELDLEGAGALVAGWYADSKSELHWPGGDALMAVGGLPPGAVKVLMILAMMADECLPRGGRVVVRVARLPEGTGFAVSAEGAGASPPDGTAEALDPNSPAESLTIRSVAAHFGALLAAQQGARIEAAHGTDRVDYATLIPAP